MLRLNRKGVAFALILNAACFAVACAIVACCGGCSGVVENGNGPNGPERVEWHAPLPRPLAPLDRASKHTTKTTAPSGESSESTCDECDGNACRAPGTK